MFIDAFSMLLLLVALSALAVRFGGPKTPPPMIIVNEQFHAIDFSDLPPLQYFEAIDGKQLAYRKYIPAELSVVGSVLLVHGSSGSSQSMHLLAKGFADAGFIAYAPDIRGHGASGSKGTISYVGQLEDDLEAFVEQVSPTSPTTLVGFSAGGGFVVRFAGSNRQNLFQSYLLLSPFLGEDAPNLRPYGGGWVNIGMPRMLALTALNNIGIHWFNNLPVVRFALNEEAKHFLTPYYSFSLAENFRPQHDYKKNIQDMHRPCAVLAGYADDVFYADRLEPIFRSLGKPWLVTLLPGIGHAALTLEPAGISTAIHSVQALQKSKGD